MDLRNALGFGRTCVRHGVTPVAIVRAHEQAMARMGGDDVAAQAERLSRSYPLLTAVMVAFGLAFRHDFDASAERHRIAQELTAAAQIQRAVVPTAVPSLPGVDLALRSEPARVVGGDYVDVLPRNDGSLFFAVGDVSGKSLAAAIVVSMVKHLLHGLIAVLGTDDLALVVRIANAIVYKDVESEVFITLCIGTLDPKTRILRWCNAGHLPPIHYQAEQRAAVELGETGIVVGAVETYAYAEQRMQLASGDTVLFVTDGLTEAFNELGEQFGGDRIAELLEHHRGASAAEIADMLYGAVLAFAHGHLEDDASLIAMKV